METNGSKVVRVGAVAGLIAGAALLIKVAHIFVLDGAEQPIQGVLYLGGIVLTIAAAAGVGARYGSRALTKTLLGFGAFFAGVFFLMMLSDGVKAAIQAVADVPEYVATEIPVALMGLVWLVVGYRLWRAGSTSVRPA